MTKVNRGRWTSDPRFEYFVYAYVFDDGHTYIGTTKSPSKRAGEHRTTRHKKTAVSMYSERTGLPVPDMLVLYSGMKDIEAQRTEDLLRKALDPELCLNIAPTGVGVGPVGGRNRRLQSELLANGRQAVARFYRKHHEKAKEYSRMTTRAWRMRKRVNKELLKQMFGEYHANLLPLHCHL